MEEEMIQETIFGGICLEVWTKYNRTRKHKFCFEAFSLLGFLSDKFRWGDPKNFKTNTLYSSLTATCIGV